MIKLSAFTFSSYLFLLACLAAPAQTASAQGLTCTYGLDVYQARQTLCADGFVNVCEANGAWTIRRDSPCSAGQSAGGGSEAASCRVSAYESAAPGATSCRAGVPQRCSDDGQWVTLQGGC